MKTATDLLTSAEVCARTGLTYRRLLYWRDKGLIAPAAQRYGGRFGAGSGPGTMMLWEPSVVGRIRELLDRIADCPFDHREQHA